VSVFLDALASEPEIGGRKILDETGLTGRYRFTLEWTPETLAPLSNPLNASSSTTGATPPASGVPIFTALQEQLGLKLRPDRGPVEVLIVEHIERPSPN
jgi:uncharacterized protein (TIGR03435 family)